MVGNEAQAFNDGGLDGHGVILHRLNRRAKNTLGRSVFLKAEDFQKTVEKWAGVPVIVANEHPTVRASHDLAKALAEVHGKLWGKLKNPQVIMAGSPRLVSEMETVKDDELERKLAEGKLGTSACWYPSPNGPDPDHVIVFEETADNRPGDPGAGFMFKEGVSDAIQEITDDFNAFKERIMSKIKQEGLGTDEKERQAFQDKVTDLSSKLDAANNALKAKEADFMAFQEKVKTLEADRAKAAEELQKFQAKAEQDKKDGIWREFEPAVPKGWKTGNVKVGDKEIPRADQTRQEFEAAPHAFMLKLKKFNEDHKGEEFQEGDGQEQSGDAPKNDNRGPGDWVWDPASKTYGWK
jgi:hypothetical protein